MELEVIKKLIRKYAPGHSKFVSNAAIAERYYNNDNDIHYREDKEKAEEKGEAKVNPIRNADNKIASGFYPLLVQQKSAYMFTAPPVFDVSNKKMNDIIVETLGDAYTKNAKQLCVNASNAGIGWVHYWKDKNGKFRWAPVPSEQVIPVFSPHLDHELIAVMRAYKEYDETTGEPYEMYEYWNESECQAFRMRADDTGGKFLENYPMFIIDPENGTMSDEYNHEMERVPFIPFPNNAGMVNDLIRIKQLIDAYDKTYSGFMDDLEDIQQVIFVLTNYGGEDLKQFVNDLKYAKAIKIDNMGSSDKSGVSTLTIEIPVEAREKMLEITRKAIFTMGQGVDPEQQGLNQTSGEAMKFVYSLLELKAGNMETEFTLGFNELIRAILRFHGLTATKIIQTWTRTSIKNDSELVQMCVESDGIISRRTILLNHPFVENADLEEKQLEEEEEKKAQREREQLNIYGDKWGDGNDEKDKK